MLITVQYPTNFELFELAREYSVNRNAFIGLSKYAPLKEAFVQRVVWQQKDILRGHTAPHVMGTDPKVDKRLGAVEREYSPIAWKESDVLGEKEILRAAEIGTVGSVMNLDREAAQLMQDRMDKTFISQEMAIWQMFAGRLLINENGVKVDEPFPVQTAQTTVPWADHENATIIKDLEAWSLKFKGKGAKAAGATIPINRKDLNDVLNNKNDADLWGFRGPGFVSLTYSLEQVNNILTARGLPNFELYEEGAVDDAGDFQYFIADGHPVIMGKRPAGQTIANFITTPSMHRRQDGKFAPGYFSIINANGQPNVGSAQIDLETLGADPNPRLKITGGIYGGPVLWYPNSVIALDVTHTGP
jgi:hypothetical protein